VPAVDAQEVTPRDSALGFGWSLAPELRPGWRVRLRIPESSRQVPIGPRSQWLRGTISRLASDTVYLHVPGTIGGELAIPSDSIGAVWRSRGVPSRGTSMLRGALGGAVAGALVGASWIWLDDDGGRPDFFGQHTAGEAAAAGAALGAAYAGVISFVWPVERWKRVKLRSRE
jgi:hypothetical protein